MTRTSEPKTPQANNTSNENKPSDRPLRIFLIGLGAVLIGVVALMIFPLGIRVEPSQTQAQPPAATSEGEQIALAAAAEVEPTGEIVEYTLRTTMAHTPPMAYIGVGGEIDGEVNPTLTANVGDTIRLTVVNGDPVLHDLVIDEFDADTGELVQLDETVVLEFVVDRPGEFTYYCSIPGHRQVGMYGLLVVEGEALAEAGGNGNVDAGIAHQTVSNVSAPAPANAEAVSVVRNPADVPPPVTHQEPMTHIIEMDAVEVEGVLDDGTTFSYFTFDGTVPGPMLRVRQGDTVEFHLHNAHDSRYPHSIDLHAVTGPGGGAVYTQLLPGESGAFLFQALSPGLYVYHCATPSVPHHISAGMYGLILVEPEEGLPPVDREFYVMQGEIYTQQPFGTAGHLDFSMDNMSREMADYLVFNGAVNGLTGDNALQAEVGESVRIYFGVGGPNYISSFHVIGEIFDRVYDQGSLTSPPLTDVQTTLVPAGGAVMVEFDVEVPGTYVLVDHSLSRLERGLAGHLIVEGEEQPHIFHGFDAEADMTGH
jgi:nitrite reductase (NO-forming)